MRVLPAALLLVASLVAQAPPPLEALFDGKTLHGWRGDPAVWSVRDGCLVGSTVGAPISANTFLVLADREPANFEFTAEFRLEGDNNSGIQYRSQELPGGGFRLAGPQCDVHSTPNYMAMLYDEQGAGIVARQGLLAQWRDDGQQVLGTIAKVHGIDLTQWHTLRVVARGNLLWHELDGRLATAILDERSKPLGRGLLGLQVHAGPPMTVWWRNPTLREYADATGMAKAVAVPAAVFALLRQHEVQAAAPKGLVPQWLWDAAAGADEELFFRRALELSAVPSAARLTVTCDNHCRIYVNGEKVGNGDEWQSPVGVDVHKQLRVGENVIAVHGWNEGGPAGMAARLSWQVDGKALELVSDATWQCHSDDPDGWNAPGFDAAGWAPVRVLAALGAAGAPWSSVLGEDALGSLVAADAPQVAVVETGLEWAGAAGPDAPQVLRLLAVPRSLGSWVSLCSDAKGCLYASDQSRGLYRIVPSAKAGDLTTIARVPVELGGCHGLLWFHDALYAVENGEHSGLYRLTDTDGDDQLDHTELLQALEGEGEHGPHSVVVAPDGEHLLVVCGNQTKLPKLAASRVPTNWMEDRLVPRLDDPNPYWEGISPPGGWVCQLDADGKQWELICCGFRNPYDLVVMPNGQIIVYDSDMEWDMGLPWYRPTRLLAGQSGVDYGWRIGSAKWPVDYPEAPPPLREIGPGSPVGMACVRHNGGSADVLALDWTFGTVYRDGTVWLSGAPLPLADVAVVAGATYLVTGGRGLPSTLLRVPIGDDDGDLAGKKGGTGRTLWGSPQTWPTQEVRAPLDILKAGFAPAGPGAGERSPADAVAARLALERLPVASYRDLVLAVDPAQPARSLTGLLALVRQGSPGDLQPVLDALGKFSFAPLEHRDRIAWLRVHSLALLRLGPANDAQRALLAQRLLPFLPSGDEREDQDLTELLAYVDAPGLLDKAISLLEPMRPSAAPSWAELTQRNSTYGGVINAMLATMPPTGQIAIANALRTVPHGWTLAQRRVFFTFLEEARTRKGGASYDGYLKKMIEAGWATCTSAEQQELAELVGKAKADAPKFRATPPKGPGRDWQLGAAEALVRDGVANGDIASGRNLFHAIGCASCHYFAGEGGNHGPDLTSLGSKFGPRDVLESVLEPSKVISDQYAGKVLTRKDGTALFGAVAKTFHGDTEVYEVMPAEANAVPIVVQVGEVAKVEPSKLSPMPTGLVNGLAPDELRDLLAFLLSRGQGLGGEAEKR